MRTIIKLSKRINSLTEETISSNRRILNVSHHDLLWRGVKRYAH